MAEPLKGDVIAVVGEDRYTFRFGGSALMAIEEAFPGETFLSALKRIHDEGEAQTLKIRDAATLVRCGLRYHHPDMDLDDAAEIAFDPAVQEAMAKAIMLAFPQANADGGDGDADADPRQTPGNNRRGTGTTRSAGGSKRAATR